MTLDQVKKLRQRTGCAILDCQKALTEADQNIEQAILLLRKKGKAKASKKAERETHEGTIASYVHTNAKIAVLVSLLCETDFVARTDKFQELARNIALHIAATDPVAVLIEDIPAEEIEIEQTVAEEQAKESGKPDDIQAKMIEGKMKKFKEEKALLTQAYVKDPNKTIAGLVNEAIQELGENITIDQFTRLSI